MNKNLVLIYTVILTFIGCQLATPTVEVKASNKYDVILLPSKKYEGFWAIGFPFEIVISNPSHKEREFTYFKYYCDYFPFEKKKQCHSGVMHKIEEGELIKKRVWHDKILAKKKKKYLFYSTHNLDTLKYPRSLFKEYYQKLQKSGLKDSLPVGTLAEFKQKHPKLVENLLKNDSIHFRFPFPKRDKIKGYAEGVRVPVKW